MSVLVTTGVSGATVVVVKTLCVESMDGKAVVQKIAWHFCAERK